MYAYVYVCIYVPTGMFVNLCVYSKEVEHECRMIAGGLSLCLGLDYGHVPNLFKVEQELRTTPSSIPSKSQRASMGNKGKLVLQPAYTGRGFTSGPASLRGIVQPFFLENLPSCQRLHVGIWAIREPQGGCDSLMLLI